MKTTKGEVRVGATGAVVPLDFKKFPTATANFGCVKCAAKNTCTLYASSLRACVAVLFLKNMRRRNTTICLSMPLDVGDVLGKGGIVGN